MLKNLNDLQALVTVAREGSFTRAAARLFISQPAVTGHIKALEAYHRELGAGAAEVLALTHLSREKLAALHARGLSHQLVHVGHRSNPSHKTWCVTRRREALPRGPRR